MNWYQKSILHTCAGKRWKRVILVDLDGTIATDAEYPAIGKPQDGVKEALQKLKDAGYRIRVYTCRLNGEHWKDSSEEHHGEYKQTASDIEEYLRDNEIPYDDIVEWDEGKPFGSWYVDDKALNYDGDWQAIVDSILSEKDD